MLHCTACGHANADDARFCGRCGHGLERHCDGCGAVLAAQQRFCTQCGRATGATASESSEGERRYATIVFSDLSGYTALNERVDPEEVGLDTLWYINDEIVRCVDELGDEDLDGFDPDTLVDFFEARGGSDFLVRWSAGEIATSAAEGKIPRLEHWADLLADRSIGLDSLMNLAGLNSFITDQKAMDDHVREVLKKTGARR